MSTSAARPGSGAAARGVNEEEVERRVFAEPVHRGRSSEKVQPDYALMHQKLKRKGGTLQLRWEAYREGLALESAYSYS